jgi:hypothetical protein
MNSANQTHPKPPPYYFKPVKVNPEPEPEKQVEQNVKNSHETPELFEPPAKRVISCAVPLPPPTPYLQIPITQRWLLDPMP